MTKKNLGLSKTEKKKFDDFIKKTYSSYILGNKSLIKILYNTQKGGDNNLYDLTVPMNDIKNISSLDFNKPYQIKPINKLSSVPYSNFAK